MSKYTIVIFDTQDVMQQNKKKAAVACGFFRTLLRDNLRR
jgi:hypothetical protein